MCHHYQAASRLPGWLVEEFSLRADLHRLDGLAGGFYPLSRVPAIRLTLAGAAEIVGLQWGLLPRWWKPSPRTSSRKVFQRRTFNARCETVDAKPAYRDAFRRRRCLLPATAFFEKGCYFTPPGEGFCFAGLWESWDGGDPADGGEGVLETCTLLTTEPNEAVRAVGHHRMPVLLTTAEACRQWMDPDAEALALLYEPFAGELTVSQAEAER